MGVYQARQNQFASGVDYRRIGELTPDLSGWTDSHDSIALDGDSAVLDDGCVPNHRQDTASSDNENSRLMKAVA
jgi:hypothetical protein